MGDYLVIDGYNIINQWPKLNYLKDQALETARKELIEIFAEYAGYYGRRTIIVFDAHNRKSANKEKTKGVEVVFTKEGETADHYIEKLVFNIAKKNRVYVATSDRVEQQVVMGAGAIRLSARDLLGEVEDMKQEIKKTYLDNKKKDSSTTLANRLNPNVASILEKWRRHRD